MGLWDWVGGKATPKDEAASAKRARNHKRHATKTDRRGWADHDRRDRRLYGE